MLRRVALVRTDVSEELSASFIRVTRIGELGTLAITSWFLQEPHGITSQKTPFFIVTAMKTNLTCKRLSSILKLDNKYTQKLK
jgi:7,8-dihydro-6-hydroxymethylpterin-pyrophosphokinase